MKKQFHTLMEYKEKVRNANAYHREKFQQTKILVHSLREEKTKLQEEVSLATSLINTRMEDVHVMLTVCCK